MKKNWQRLLGELLGTAVQIRSDGDPEGQNWEITLSDERMEAFEKMGLWNMEQAGREWND